MLATIMGNMLDLSMNINISHGLVCAHHLGLSC